MHFGARESAAVDQAGVIFGVGENRIAAIHQCRDRAEVRGESGAEQQRGFRPLKLRELPLQFACEVPMARDQRTGPRAQPSCCAARAAAADNRGSAARPR